MKLPFVKKRTTSESIHFAWNPIHPRRDWRRLVIVSFVVLIAIISWSIYLFFTTGSRRSTVIDTTVMEQKTTTAQVERISAVLEKSNTPDSVDQPL